MYKRAFLNVVHRSFCAITEYPGFSIHAELHWSRAHAVVERDSFAVGIDIQHQPGSVGWRTAAFQTDAAGKNLVVDAVKHRIDINALTRLQRQLGRFRTLAKDVGTLIEADSPMPTAEDRQGQLVADMIDTGQRSPNNGSYPLRNRGRIENGIVSISAQSAGCGRRAIEYLRLRLLRLSRGAGRKRLRGYRGCLCARVRLSTKQRGG